MANNKKTNNSGWNFQTGSGSSSSGDRRDQPEDDVHLIHDIWFWFQDNQRLLLGFSSFVLVFFVLLVFASGQPNKPTYDIPGGDIEVIQERKLTEWLQVTEQLAKRRGNFEQGINPGGSLFTFYSALGERPELQSAVLEICKNEFITVDEYRDITHEIALTAPQQNLKGYREWEEQNGNVMEEETTPDNKQARIRRNLRLLSDHYDQFQRVWNELNQDNEPTGAR